MSTVGPRLAAEPLDQAFAAGEAGLREAYDAHGSLVYSICRRALGADAAQQVTQDVFVSIWRAREQFNPQKGTLAAWLVGTTKRRIIDHLRSEGRHADRRADVTAADAREAQQPQIEQMADRMLVADALRALPNRVREAIELAYLHDLTHQDIAQRTGIPLGTIKSDIRRGLLRIRDHLESSSV